MPTVIGQAPRSFEPVPEGDYLLTISKVTEEIISGENAKHKGETMWRLTYDIEGINRKVFDNLIFVPKSFWRVSNWWRALGNEVIPNQPFDTGEPEEHLKKTIRAHISIEQLNSGPDNKIDYYIEPKPGEAALPAKSTTPDDKEPDNIPF
jgi:hypothetical protein